MIARRKKAFYRLCRLLRVIESNPDNLDVVKQLNVNLVTEILRDERHIVRHKLAIKELRRALRNDRPSRALSTLLRANISRTQRYVDKYIEQIYVWKCIGDAVAYAYIDSFNIKHVFFDTEYGMPKQNAGALDGKDGLANELAILFSAIEHGVPAVLCDVTNVLRFGDVCLLGGSDPVPIEVKSSKRLNQRGKRQKASLEKLMKFLEEDQAKDFRGTPLMKRVESSVSCREYSNDLNHCIEEAYRDGYNVICPERGVIYAAILGDEGASELVTNLNMDVAVVAHLNTDKSARNWAPYIPFINSIRNLDHLYDFMIGNLSILVCLDVAYICDLMLLPNWKVSFVEDVDIAIVLKNSETGGKFVISRQFFGRMIYEFVSPQWFVQQEQEFITRAVESPEGEYGEMVGDDYIIAWESRLDGIAHVVERE